MVNATRATKGTKASTASKKPKRSKATQADGDVRVEPSAALLERLTRSRYVAGLDEAGRGPLAGPVVAAAVVLPTDKSIQGLDDSKKLDAETRDALFDEIMRQALAVGIGVHEVERIDEMNILRASLDAMRIAFEECEQKLGRRIGGAVVDGNMLAPLPKRVLQEAVIGGDAISPCIMAASIVAKVTRDRRMVEEATRWPGYGFEQHKGYATPQHREALMRLGPCPLHRRSFITVREALALQLPGMDAE